MDEEQFVSALIERTGDDESLIGDDCAVLEEFNPPLLLTTDVLNESIHYDEGYSAGDIGQKLVTANVSDIYAMGGEPKWGLLSISSNRSDDERDQLIDTVVSELGIHQTSLVGGDVSAISDSYRESVSLTIVGRAHPDGLLRRDRASDGDRIAVSGALGGPPAILSKPIDERRDRDQKRLASPANTASVAGELVEAGVQCGIDISDGLLKDLGRVCNRSGVAATLNHRSIPIDPIAEKYARSDTDALEWALTGGEEFQLLVTIPESVDLEDRLASLTEIGRITAGSGIHWEPPLPTEIDLSSGGYDHFSA